MTMPTLKHLLEELRKLRADPGNVRIPGRLYDDLVAQAEGEESDGEDSEDEED